MKKPVLVALLSICITAIVFLAGIFVGRNSLSPAGAVPASAALGGTASLTDTGSRLLNINSADIWQLQELPGIGELLAQRIVDYRTAHGRFTSLQQLIAVEGIGQNKLENILGLICLED